MGSAIRYRIVRCTEETQAYPDFAPFISFLLALLVLGHRHFGRVFSYFPTQPLHIPSRLFLALLKSGPVSMVRLPEDSSFARIRPPLLNLGLSKTESLFRQEKNSAAEAAPLPLPLFYVCNIRVEY